MLCKKLTNFIITIFKPKKAVNCFFFYFKININKIKFYQESLIHFFLETFLLQFIEY